MPSIISSPLSALSALDVHRLYKLRVDVFVNEQQCPYAEIDDIDALETTTHIRALDGDELLGTARIFPALHDGEEVTQFGRFALAPAARGSRTAPSIMETALELAPGTVFLEAQSPLVDYYAAYGFVVCGDEFLDEGIPHTPMIRR